MKKIMFMKSNLGIHDGFKIEDDNTFTPISKLECINFIYQPNVTYLGKYNEVHTYLVYGKIDK